MSVAQFSSVTRRCEARPAFQKVNLRKAVNPAIDRPSMLRVAGKYAGKRTDQILPPLMPGYREGDIYPTVKQPNFALAKKLQLRLSGVREATSAS